MSAQLALLPEPARVQPTPPPLGQVSFYLGTHMPSWLAQLDVPLFVSRRRLAPMKTLPRARAPWALDSGGFTELSLHRGWTVEAREYAGEVRRFMRDIGSMRWAAPQDWMVEPFILDRTRLTVDAHQRFTVNNFCELKAIAPDVPWIPVLQGWCRGDYLDCIELYERRGVDLREEPVVGVGSVCRRQSSLSVSMLLGELADMGLRLHGFGVKMAGLDSLGGRRLASADSLAWSFNARAEEPLPGCTHANCANCPTYALAWRERLLARLREPW